jgi:peptidoglycan-associated lipoprotein
MVLTKIVGLLAALILSIGMACKKPIPVVKLIKPVEAAVCNSEVCVEEAATSKPVVVKQEVLLPVENIDSVVEPEILTRFDVNDLSKCPKAENIPDINFDLDSYLIRDADKPKLQSIADLLEVNQKIKIQISGNCDERGTTEYNLILGERRAYAACNYLLGLGITRDRLSTISYGKEKPKADGHDKESWFINRNCQFLQQ